MYKYVSHSVCVLALAAALILNSTAHAQSDKSKSAEVKSKSVVDISDIDDDSSDYMSTEKVYDPYESVNRSIFGFNEMLDAIIFKPIAKVYEFVVPEWGRDRVSSAVDNLHEPVVFVNHVLQGDIDKAAETAGRFVTNSTVGLLGAFDVASAANVKPHPTDFGLTLKSKGVGKGAYLVLPVLGPSNMRDFPGLLVDSAMDPWNYKLDNAGKITRYSVEVVDKKQRSLKIFEQIDRTSLDKYSAIRSMFNQKR